MPGQSRARVFHQTGGGSGAELPKGIVRDLTQIMLQIFLCSQPAIFAASLGPKLVCSRGIPGWHVHPIGHMADGNLFGRPLWKKRSKQVPADLAMQATHAVNRTAAANGQVSHV